MDHTSDALSLLAPRPVEIAAPRKLRKLDLGCGQNVRPGFEGLDLLSPKADVKIDLLRFPWPIDDESCDELNCSHFIEHIPAREVTRYDLWSAVDGGLVPGADEFVGQDMLLAFFDECHRILIPGGTMKVIWPALQSVRAFQDPTHRRYIPSETMLYLNAEWRKVNGLDHYLVRCDFAGEMTHTCQEEMNLLHPDAAKRRFVEGWNTIYDFHVTLTKRAP